MIKTRKYLRVPVPMAVMAKVSDKDAEFRHSSLQDISWGGALLLLNPPAASGSRVIIQFALPDDRVSLELWGKVVRVIPKSASNPGGMGIEFDPLDEDSRSLIQQLVNEEIKALLGAAKGE